MSNLFQTVAPTAAPAETSSAAEEAEAAPTGDAEAAPTEGAAPVTVVCITAYFNIQF
jgi:hypothetical protein